MPGLMAVGEAACVSVHGANRLGSNSLLDIVVFGREAARQCAATLRPGAAQPPLPKDAGELAISRLDRLRHASGNRPTAELRLQMQKIMQSDAAVFRTAASLTQGAARLARTIRSLPEISVKDRSLIWNSGSDRDAGVRESPAAGHRHDALCARSQGESRCARARGLSAA